MVQIISLSLNFQCINATKRTSKASRKAQLHNSKLIGMPFRRSLRVLRIYKMFASGESMVTYPLSHLLTLPLNDAQENTVKVNLKLMSLSADTKSFISTLIPKNTSQTSTMTV